MEFARKNCIDNGIWKDFVNLIHKQTNYRQIILFYISWLNYTLSKMLSYVTRFDFFAIINTRNF